MRKRSSKVSLVSPQFQLEEFARHRALGVQFETRQLHLAGNMLAGAEVIASTAAAYREHAEPLLELRRLYEESRRYYLPFLSLLPRRGDPGGTFDRAAIEAELPRRRGALEE